MQKNIKASTLWHAAPRFSASLSLPVLTIPEIMPQIEEDTQYCAVWKTKHVAIHWATKSKGVSAVKGSVICDVFHFITYLLFESLILNARPEDQC